MGIERQDGLDETPFLLETEYEETEACVAREGAREAQLMAQNPSRPLLPTSVATAVVREEVVKAPRGFGGGGGKHATKRKAGKHKVAARQEEATLPSSSSQQAADAQARVLRTQGLVTMDKILSADVTDALRAFVYDTRTTEVNKLQANVLQSKFPTIRRWDLSLPLFAYDDDDQKISTTIAHDALQQILTTTVVGETMRRFLGTDQAALYELSSYISDPGSTRQVIHADTPCFGKERDRQPILCTCFLALQDVRLDMGPTLFLPQTNTYAMHALFFGEEDSGATSTPVKDHFLQTHPSVLGMLPKGSCVLFDSRLLHCGTANTSVEDSRALFFFSFQHPGITLSNPGGDTASIRSDVKGRFRLSDFVKVGT
jgi:ectoine hydroxylase-related dioxygenase (phytanoyl-CoA dioxygenase family)